MAKRPRTLADVKVDPRITEVWTEKDGCWPDINKGVAYWASLAKGYNWDGCSTIHEPTVKRLCEALEDVKEGPTY